MDLNGSLNLQQHLAQILKTGRPISEKVPARLDKIKEEWFNLVNGKPVNKNIVPRTIYESWQRSMAYGVDPYAKNSADNIALAVMERRSGTVKVVKIKVKMFRSQYLY